MKKFSKKGVLLFAGAMAICAFAVPSMASGASWAGNEHDTLHSSGLGFTAPGPVNSNCTAGTLTVTRSNAAVLTVTSGSFSGCVATIAGSTCTSHWLPTAFPWRATAVSTTDIQIHDIKIDITFTNADGCLAPQSFTLTGTLRGGSWDGNGVTQRTITFSDAEGLTSHANGVATPWTIRGSFFGPNTTVLM